MAKLALLTFIPVFSGMLLFHGCSTASQRTEYNTLASVEASGTALVDGYYLAAAKGLATTNGIPKVAKEFNQFQSVISAAELLAENGSNALAPSNVVAEFSVLAGVVSEFAPQTSTTKITPTP